MDVSPVYQVLVDLRQACCLSKIRPLLLWSGKEIKYESDRCSRRERHMDMKTLGPLDRMIIGAEFKLLDDTTQTCWGKTSQG